MYKNTAIGKNFDGDNVLLLPKGAGYAFLRDAWDIWINKIKKLADNIILISHVRDAIIEKSGKEVNAKDLALTGN